MPPVSRRPKWLPPEPPSSAATPAVTPRTDAGAPIAAPATPAARARRSPARRPSTARCRRPAPWAWRSGRRASGPSPSGRRPPAPVDRRVELARRRGSRPRCTARSTVADVVALERRPAGQQAVERRPQAVDVATAGPGAPGRPRPARGSCTPACPARVPGSVSAEPLAERWAPASARPVDAGSARPSALASPQSTTSVSPCLPTMMLPGLMSRCSTPRLWA